MNFRAKNVEIPTFIFGAKIQISILATIRMRFFWVIFKRCESYKPLNQVHRLLRDPQYHHWSMVRPESCSWPKFQQVVKISTSTYSFPAGCCANTTTDTFRQRLFYKARKGGASPFLRGLFFLADHLVDWAGWILCSHLWIWIYQRFAFFQFPTCFSLHYLAISRDTRKSSESDVIEKGGFYSS